MVNQLPWQQVEVEWLGWQDKIARYIPTRRESRRIFASSARPFASPSVRASVRASARSFASSLLPIRPTIHAVESSSDVRPPPRPSDRPSNQECVRPTVRPILLRRKSGIMLVAGISALFKAHTKKPQRRWHGIEYSMYSSFVHNT